MGEGEPVSFGVECETVRRRRRLFLFWAGGGPVSFGVGCETVRRRRRRAVCFCFGGGDGGESASGAVKGVRGASQLWSWETVCRRRRLFLFWAGGGPVSFGVGCETVRRHRRRAVCFCFGGGTGASQLPGLRRGKGGQSALELGVKLFVVVAVCFCFGRAGGQSALELGVKLFVVVAVVPSVFVLGADGASQLPGL